MNGIKPAGYQFYPPGAKVIKTRVIPLMVKVKPPNHAGCPVLQPGNKPVINHLLAPPDLGLAPPAGLEAGRDCCCDLCGALDGC